MKTSLIVFLLALGILATHADQVYPISQATDSAATDYAIIPLDGNSTLWQWTTSGLTAEGKTVSQTHKFTELATGLNHLVNDQWVESKEQIDILPDGTAAAVNGQHQVYFPNDIYNGRIKMVTADGKIFNSQPVGLIYDNGRNTAFIAVLTNSVGQLISSNQVLYPHAFAGINADLLYTYTKAGFEQDIILREQPPTPGLYNLDPNETRLEVMTEFFDPPQPDSTVGILPEQAGMKLEDETLEFGSMRMVPGKAFVLGENSPTVQVAKSWVALEGRRFLLEAVPVAALANDLQNLPSADQASGASVTRAALRLPPQHLVQKSPQPIQLARTDLNHEPGFVLDYVTQNTSLTNYTFQGDLTYYISGTIYLYGTNTFEGGSVLKYASGVAIYAYQTGHATAVKWLASAYRPVIFTAKDDNTIGETISGSTGSPSGYYATYVLNFYENSTPISYFRVAYAQKGFSANYGTDSFSNGQFVNCQVGVENYSDVIKLRNLLFENVQTNINDIYYGTVDAENITFSGSSYLVSLTVSSGPLSLTNCILANISNLTNSVVYSSTFTGDHNGFYGSPSFGTSPITSTSYPFNKVGGGSYYLTNGGSFISAGTANIDPILLAALGQKTVYPPTVYSNQTLHSILVLGPVVQRDTNVTPSLGYHYDPLDYVFGGCDLYTNLTFAPGTAVGWFENQGGVSSSGQPYGISLNTGANFTEIGTVTAPCYMVRYETVQEGYNGNWNNRGWMSGLMVNGNGSSPLPQINAQFTKWMVSAEMCNLFRDNWDYGQATFNNCEFYVGGMATYDQSFLRYTNCLFFRNGIYFNAYEQSIATSATFQDCTFYNGFLCLDRFAGQPANMWIIENTAFDGTGFSMQDNQNGNTNYTQFNYNAYNTNNLSGFSYPYPYTPVPTNYLETVGVNDVKTTNYNWQASWFGNYYLPTNSPLIDAGSTTAGSQGLFVFTTQTNQVPEYNTTVDIGYHYEAADNLGNPIYPEPVGPIFPPNYPYQNQPYQPGQPLAGVNYIQGNGGLGTYVYAMAVDANSNLYVGGDFQIAGAASAAYNTIYATFIDTNIAPNHGNAQAGHIAVWSPDAAGWSSLMESNIPTLGNGVYNSDAFMTLGYGRVNSIVIGSDANVYVGGILDGCPGPTSPQPAHAIALWNPSLYKWFTLGNGLSFASPRYEPAFISGMAESNKKIYVVGSFTQAGIVGVTNIAAWDMVASNWVNVGPPPFAATPSCIAIDGNDVYVGAGVFGSNEGVAAYNSGPVFAHGTLSGGNITWQSIFTNVIWNIQTIAVTPTHRVFVGGGFYGANPSPGSLCYLAELNKTNNTLSNLPNAPLGLLYDSYSFGNNNGPGIGVVSSMISMKTNQLVIGGAFDLPYPINIGGNVANNIIGYNLTTSNFFAMGAGSSGINTNGVNRYVEALASSAVQNDNFIYAGGSFNEVNFGSISQTNVNYVSGIQYTNTWFQLTTNRVE